MIQMDNPKSLKNRERNIEGFCLVAAACADIEMFPFFGTLLGITREDNLLAFDDDVDFYVSINDRSRLEERLSKLPVTVDLSLERNHSPYFLQAAAVIDGEEVLIDFYFYEAPSGAPFISDRWNFSGFWTDPRNEMRVPSEIVFPLQRKSLFGIEFFLPSSPELCCRFLYGSSWEKPLSKGSQYFISIYSYAPKVWLDEIQLTTLQGQLERAQSDLLSSNERLAAISDELYQTRKRLKARKNWSRIVTLPLRWIRNYLPR